MHLILFPPYPFIAHFMLLFTSTYLYLPSFIYLLLSLSLPPLILTQCFCNKCPPLCSQVEFTGPCACANCCQGNVNNSNSNLNYASEVSGIVFIESMYVFVSYSGLTTFFRALFSASRIIPDMLKVFSHFFTHCQIYKSGAYAHFPSSSLHFRIILVVVIIFPQYHISPIYFKIMSLLRRCLPCHLNTADLPQFAERNHHPTGIMVDPHKNNG